MRKNFLGILFFSALFTACEQKQKQTEHAPAGLVLVDSMEVKPSTADSLESKMINDSSAIEKQLIAAGLVDIVSVDSSIAVDLKYSSCDNFLFLDMYGDLSKCYLQPDVALKLKKAQGLLKEKYPYYSLIVFDGVRPRSIQFRMWDTIAVPAFERSKYVSNPQNGSLHNFGAAVDLSIIDKNGIVLDMGTPYDYFGELAYPREEQRMIREGRLTHKQLFNREVLREAMQAAGFTGITTEWWHFNSCSRNEAMLKYKIVE
ncbi:MAG: peptidase vanX D-ala-D-ala dipeptidase [Bacteroidetes bacterium]|nr:peptidase vanX D-ala-D-ala dipeptidase [Bacteroidota bacterium]